MSELLDVARDLGKYLSLGLERAVAPRLGRGVDYAGPEFAHSRPELLARLHPRRMQLRVEEIIQETPSTKTLRFARRDGPLPPFRAGQYVNLLVNVDGVRTSRPYSISSPPGGDHLDLTVRDQPSGFVAPYLLRQVQIGDTLESTGPAGSFYHQPLIDGSRLVMLAGGSGITPMISMIREQAALDWPLEVHLLYGSRRPDDVIFGEELARLAAQSSRFAYSLVVSEPPPGYQGLAGLLDRDLIRSQVGDFDGRTVFVCGPTQMYELCLAALAALGVPGQRIRREVYGPPAEVTRLAGWPAQVARDAVFQVEVAGHGTIAAAAAEPLLCSLERQHIVVPVVCRSGECSACRTRILAGQVFMPPQAGVRLSDRAMGYVHACVAYPLSDLRIRVG